MIYLDNASTTKTSEKVNGVIADALEKDFFNPSALHTQGFLVGQKINRARKSVLASVGANSFGLVFTGSATEANNMALAQVLRGKILVGAGEHPSVKEKAKEMMQRGFNVAFLPLGADGTIDIEYFRNQMTPDVSFVSVQMVSNETGAINDIEQIVKIAKSVNPKVIVHSDMVQALGKVPVNLARLGVDMASFSAHKIAGPKGIGALVFKNGLNIKPLIFGGGQESGLRSGTENVPQILAFETAVCDAVKSQANAFESAKRMREKLLDGFRAVGSNFTVHGNGSPFVLSVSFEGVRGETLMHALEEDEILISTGSACSSKKAGNATLEAMGVDKDEVMSNVRISFGYEVFDDDTIFNVANIIANKAKQLRVVKKGR